MRHPAHLDVSLVMLLIKADHAHLLNPDGTTEFPQLGHPHPSLPQLSQVVIHLSTSHLIASKLLQVLGNLVSVHLLEALVCSNTTFNQLAHTTQDKGRHCTSPAHSTPRVLLSTSLHLLTISIDLDNLITLQINPSNLLSHPLIMSVIHCLSV